MSKFKHDLLLRLIKLWNLRNDAIIKVDTEG